MYTDFVMSDRFGLDWQEYDAVRMTYFYEIMRIEAEKAQKDAKKQDSKPQFRKRM